MNSFFKGFSISLRVSLVFMFLCHQAFAGVKFEDNFESGDLSKTTNGYRWKSSTKVSSDIAPSGEYSIKFTFNGKPAGDASSEQRIVFGENMTDLYVEFYIYYPDGTEGLGAKFHHRDDDGPDNNKFFRVWDDDYRKYNVKYGFSSEPRFSPDKSIIFPEYARNVSGMSKKGMSYSRSGIGDAELGKWHKMNIRISVDTGKGAVIKLWKDDSLLVDNTVSNYPDGGVGNYLRNAYFLGWANSGFSQTTNIYIDDVRISDRPFGDIIASPNPPRINEGF